MIVSRLIGGLGNQLFQYAAGRKLAIEKQSELFLDLSFLKQKAGPEYTQRHFELGQLNVSCSIAVDDIQHKFPHSFFARLLNSLSGPKNCVVTESNYTKATSCDNVYLQGFWQSEKYFKSIRNELLKEIQPAVKMPASFYHFTGIIRGVNAVAVHVRRGDYVTLKSASSFHGVCDIDYYLRAMELLRQKTTNPVFFIFSDDPDWCKQNFPLSDQIRFVEGNHETAIADLFLMSFCNHNIIANSSFSWWGAWLNKNKDKLVVAPKQWFLDPGVEAGEIYAENWIRL